MPGSSVVAFIRGYPGELATSEEPSSPLAALSPSIMADSHPISAVARAAVDRYRKTDSS